MKTFTSLKESKTRSLWEGFMPKRKEVLNCVDSRLYSVQEYDENIDFDNFSPETTFTTWAAVEISALNDLPVEMESLIIEAGLYAVFIHKGATGTFNETAKKIFEQWLPDSIYQVDRRLHFEIMGERYLGPDNPESEEEIWLPITLK